MASEGNDKAHHTNELPPIANAIAFRPVKVNNKWKK